jgi:multiple sugar transport system substrate-binding protein
MLKTIRRLAFATAASCIALTAAAPAFADTTLKFVSWQRDEPGVMDWWAALIKEFEATHPGVKVEWTKVARASFADTMTTLFAGGTPPDIVHLAAFEFQQFANNGWLEDLGPYVESAKLDLNGWTGQSACEYQDQTVCLMLLYTGYVMAYNQDLFDKGGVKLPTNWTEYLAALKTLTKDNNGDGIPDQFGTGHDTAGGGSQYVTEMMNYLLDTGARFTDADGKITIDTPEMAEGLARWKEVVKGGLTPRDLPSADIRQLFSDGRIAIRFDGPQIWPIAAKSPNAASLKIAPVPFEAPVGGGSNVLGMAADISDDNKKLVWDFIALAASDKMQSAYSAAVSSPAPSPRADMTEARGKVPPFDIIADAAKRASDAGIDRLPKGLETQFNEFAKMMKEEAQRMIIDDLDPKTVAATMHQKAEAIQKQ